MLKFMSTSQVESVGEGVTSVAVVCVSLSLYRPQIRVHMT